MGRKIAFVLCIGVFIWGVYGILHRSVPVDKYIGSVYITDESGKHELKGYEAIKTSDGETTISDLPPLDKLSDEFYAVSRKSGTMNEGESGSGLSLSFEKDYYGDVKYTLYDSSNKELYKDRTELKIPGDRAGDYIVRAEVTWGRKDNNITLMYFFKISFTDK